MLARRLPRSSPPMTSGGDSTGSRSLRSKTLIDFLITRPLICWQIVCDWFGPCGRHGRRLRQGHWCPYSCLRVHVFVSTNESAGEFANTVRAWSGTRVPKGGGRALEHMGNEDQLSRILQGPKESRDPERKVWVLLTDCWTPMCFRWPCTFTVFCLMNVRTVSKSSLANCDNMSSLSISSHSLPFPPPLPGSSWNRLSPSGNAWTSCARSLWRSLGHP